MYTKIQFFVDKVVKVLKFSKQKYYLCKKKVDGGNCCKKKCFRYATQFVG